MKLSQTVESAVATEITVSPELLQKIESSLAMYDMYRQALDAEKTLINALLDEAGIKKVEAGDHVVYITAGGTSSSLDKKKLIAQGVTDAMIDAATTRKPKKPYMTIRKKSEKTESGDE